MALSSAPTHHTTAGCHIVMLSNMLRSRQAPPPAPGPTSSASLSSAQAALATQSAVSVGFAASISGGSSTATAVAASSLDLGLPLLVDRLCGPLPPYHPAALRALLAKGKVSAACRLLRALIAWLREQSEVLLAAAGGPGEAVPQAASEQLSLGSLGKAAAADLSLLGCGGTAALLQLCTQLQPGAATSTAASPGATAATAAAASAVSGALPPSAVHSGLLDLAAFDVVQDDVVPPRTPQGQSALDTGMVDMSAFGMDDFPPPPPPTQQQQQGRSALDTGMVDMSAFGMDDFPPPPPPPQQQQGQSALDTGMVDMSAFGMGDFPPPPPPAPTSSVPAADQLIGYSRGATSMVPASAAVAASGQGGSGGPTGGSSGPSGGSSSGLLFPKVPEGATTGTPPSLLSGSGAGRDELLPLLLTPEELSTLVRTLDLDPDLMSDPGAVSGSAGGGRGSRRARAGLGGVAERDTPPSSLPSYLRDEAPAEEVLAPQLLALLGMDGGEAVELALLARSVCRQVGGWVGGYVGGGMAEGLPA